MADELEDLRAQVEERKIDAREKRLLHKAVLVAVELGIQLSMSHDYRFDRDGLSIAASRELDWGTGGKGVKMQKANVHFDNGLVYSHDFDRRYASSHTDSIGAYKPGEWTDVLDRFYDVAFAKETARDEAKARETCEAEIASLKDYFGL
ncbi:MAG: hypothetical protein KKF56_03535 [Nanoarchaeota archaeon]|nr:hypothetical protein [Nanoarchaeota archaeon]